MVLNRDRRGTLTWLITGAAGYIGAHVLREFVKAGHEIVCIDSLESGVISRIPRGTPFMEGDIRNPIFLKEVFEKYKVQNIVHLAAKKSVAESAKKPEDYRQVNIMGTQNLVECARNFKIGRFIFSSSAAVYGNLASGIANENDQTSPMSYYGQTKLECEDILNIEFQKGNFMGSSLRFFNVAGTSHLDLMDNSKDNLIPLVISKIKANTPPEIFGRNYPTKDGTCVRDYVHVSDIARAHLLLAESPIELPSSVNIGTGVGVSVLEVIKLVQLMMDNETEPVILTPREGDPASLIADPTLMKEKFNFHCRDGIREIISSLF